MYKDDKKKKLKTAWKKIWWFIWEDDSIWSWIVNIVLAFVIIKFLIYPGLGLVLGTTHPVVAVVSGSMEHKLNQDGEICGVYPETFENNFDNFWEVCGEFYRERNVNKLQFLKYPFKNGFNTGDIMVLLGKNPEKIDVGDVLVFQAEKPDPIIHRVIAKWEENGIYYFTTKGDHNENVISDPSVYESKINEDRLIGKAVFKIPYLGYIKMWFVDLLDMLKLDGVKKLFS